MEMESYVDLVGESSVLFLICKLCEYIRYIMREKETIDIFEICLDMRDIIDTEPCCHGETTSHEVWKNAMIEEYQSIMKKYMWDIVLRRKGKSIVNSK